MADINFGDCVEVVCNHLGNTYRYSPKSNESANVDRGGIRANDDANQVTANGKMMSQLNMVRWMFDTPVADETGAVESLELMAGSPSLGTWQFSMISGSIFKGVGRPVGDITVDNNAGTISFKVSGGGKLEKI
jgi:hypothetical protein